MEGQAHPQAREDGLVVRELPDEILVYDLERHEAHCLNSTAGVVWKACDGRRSPAELAEKLKLQEDVVWLALEELWKRELLQGERTPDSGSEAERGISRAEVLKRAGVGAAAISLPAVVSLVAPSAAHAVTCLGSGSSCTVTSQCCQNLTCISGTCT